MAFFCCCPPTFFPHSPQQKTTGLLTAHAAPLRNQGFNFRLRETHISGYNLTIAIPHRIHVTIVYLPTFTDHKKSTINVGKYTSSSHGSVYGDDFGTRWPSWPFRREAFWFRNWIAFAGSSKTLTWTPRAICLPESWAVRGLGSNGGFNGWGFYRCFSGGKTEVLSNKNGWEKEGGNQLRFEMGRKNVC